MPHSSCARVAFIALAASASSFVLPTIQIYNQEIVTTSEHLRNGSAVPGDSPVNYNNDPSGDLFEIESLNMYPNPCVMYVQFTESRFSK